MGEDTRVIAVTGASRGIGAAIALELAGRGFTVGCLTRRGADTALWLDIAAGAPPGDAHTPPPFDGSWVDAATTPPGRLRIGTSTKPARSLIPPAIDATVTGAVERATEVLTDLGHTVSERTPDYGLVGNEVVADRAAVGVVPEVHPLERVELQVVELALGAVVSLAVVTAWCGHGLRLAVREWRACVCGCDGGGVR